jgi:hypothetical protein
MRKLLAFFVLTSSILLSSCDENGNSITTGCFPAPNPTPAVKPYEFKAAETYSCKNILIDASRDGGTWWYPQYSVYNPEYHHQGKELADYLRRKGYRVDELQRDMPVKEEYLKNYAIIIRTGGFGKYSADEIAAYTNKLHSGATLLLIGDHMTNNTGDALAESLGVKFSGSINGNVDKFKEHNITTGVTSLNYIAGSVISSEKYEFLPLATLNGNTVMASYQYASSPVFILGDVNGIESVPQPLTDNLVNWMSQGCSY